jgi:dipeptidyl aminopeptidase/acylaminoacyl peptidase
MKTHKLIAFLIWLPLLGNTQSWNPGQMIHVKRLTSAIVSPDGNKVAYTVSTPLIDGEKSEYLTHIWMAGTDGTLNRQFTFGDKSCSNIQFSPDNKYLTFTSSRKEKTQIYLMAVDGGEAESITNQKNNVGAYSWSPDGKKIAFLMTDTLTAKEEKDKKEKRDMEIVDHQYKNSHLYVLSIQKNSKGEYPVKRLTRGDFHITDLNWSPDSRTIVFSYQQSPSADFWTTSDISSIPADSGSVKLLVNNKGQDNNPKFSPDGQWIAFESDGGKASWAGRSDIYIMPANGGAPKKLAATFDQNPDLIDWSPDGKSVWIGESFKTKRVVYSLPIDGKNPKMLTSPDGVYSSPSFSKKSDLMACIFQDVSTPPEVMIMSLTDQRTKKLSSINEDFSQMKHAGTEIISWKSKDGKYVIEGLITYPKDYRKNRKYPLILNIHGGPAGVFNQSYTGAGSTFPLQAFADQGYVIIRPNPRGSGGYGADFRQANHNDWGFGDYDDIMAGVDKLVSENIAHPDSLCVTGWSYGGYMTSMIITKTNRFKAAVVGAGVTNLMSFTGTSDIPGFLPDYFDVEMWDRTDVFMKHSAMFAIKNVKTPTLILHGGNDLRVPLSHGQELYSALKRMGVRTEMVVYPRTQHGPEEPKFIQDIGERIIDWFNKQLKRDLSNNR